MVLRLATMDLHDDIFMPILSGQTIEREIDIAELYEIFLSDTYKVKAAGAFPYAPINSTALTDRALPFVSNTLVMDIDGAEAVKVEKALDRMHFKRTNVQNDCTGTKLDAVNTALRNCSELATAASTAAKSGSDDRFQEYFKTTNSSVRQTVADRFTAVATDCSTNSSGATDTYCNDVYDSCTSNVLAYAVPNNNLIVYCPIFFDDLPPLAQDCHQQDRATTVLHEETHNPGVYSPGTMDNGYGYSAATALSSSQAVMNADSYALFANGQSTIRLS